MFELPEDLDTDPNKLLYISNQGSKAGARAWARVRAWAKG